MADEWLTVAEASRLFLASETTIRKRVKSGELNGRQLPQKGKDVLHVAKSELAKLFCLRVEDAETIDEVMAGQSKMAALLKLSDNNLVATLVGVAAAAALPLIWQWFREWSIGVLGLDEDTSDASLIEQFDEKFDSGETVKMQLERSIDVTYRNSDTLAVQDDLDSTQHGGPSRLDGFRNPSKRKRLRVPVIEMDRMLLATVLGPPPEDATPEEPLGSSGVEGVVEIIEEIVNTFCRSITERSPGSIEKLANTVSSMEESDFGQTHSIGFEEQSDQLIQRISQITGMD
ncbi:MAG: hypothetical protein R3C18_27805, partial [Planctomycetaceae bacterium]